MDFSATFCPVFQLDRNLSTEYQTLYFGLDDSLPASKSTQTDGHLEQQQSLKFRNKQPKYAAFKVQALVTCANFFVVFGLCCCFLISLVVNYEEATATHCHVTNLLPSISALASLEPQKLVWKIAMTCHCFPRLLMMVLNYKANVK